LTRTLHCHLLTRSYHVASVTNDIPLGCQQLKKTVDGQQFIGGDCLQMIRTSEHVFFIIHIHSKRLRLKNNLYYIGTKRLSRPKDSQQLVKILILYLQINMSVLRTH